ncbi:signal peptidase II [Corynebacterium ulceribovis]|uniref:signal peptidase II n=1 Tax=Corynebacterium ulceribovis TaxID=487732 RepID=UPI00039DBF54|nr:signal peptidase II [Corynebacterium ulceribovis]
MPPTATPNRRKSKAGLLALIAIATIVIDQISKITAINALDSGRVIDVLGSWLTFRLVRNPGAAFSMGVDVTWLFTTIQLVFVLGVVAYTFWARKVTDTVTAVSLGLLAGGAAGNLTDRLLREPGFYHGHVIDFIAVDGFAIFNLADCAISVGVAILAAWIIFGPQEAPQSTPQEVDADA